MGMGFTAVFLISNGHIRSFPGLKNIQPIEICDVREKEMEKTLDVLTEKGFKDIKVSTPQVGAQRSPISIHSGPIAGFLSGLHLKNNFFADRRLLVIIHLRLMNEREGRMRVADR
jgi:hypothetical protein